MIVYINVVALHINEIRDWNNRRRKNTIALFERLLLADRKKRLNWLIEVVYVIHINECQSILYQSRHIDTVLWESFAFFFFHLFFFLFLSFIFFFTFSRTHIRLLSRDSKYTSIGWKSFFKHTYLCNSLFSCAHWIVCIETTRVSYIHIYEQKLHSWKIKEKKIYIDVHANIYHLFLFIRSTFISFLSRNCESDASVKDTKKKKGLRSPDSHWVYRNHRTTYHAIVYRSRRPMNIYRTKL